MSDVDNIPPSLLVPHYLIHCAAYYRMAFTIISDHDFDRLAQRLKKLWRFVSHRHKDVIDYESIGVGGSHLKLPTMAIGAATRFRPLCDPDYVHTKPPKPAPKFDNNFFKSKKIDKNFFRPKGMINRSRKRSAD